MHHDIQHRQQSRQYCAQLCITRIMARALCPQPIHSTKFHPVHHKAFFSADALLWTVDRRYNAKAPLHLLCPSQSQLWCKAHPMKKNMFAPNFNAPRHPQGQIILEAAEAEAPGPGRR